jgi:predicted transcriptional regulator YdeE
MEKFIIADHIPVIGFQVKTFPIGIGEAFDSLFKKFPDGLSRNYYGISYFNDTEDIVYIVAATELKKDDAVKYQCENYLIKKGEYNAVPVFDWQNKTDSIKDVFHEMMSDKRPDKDSPCIEWYKTDDEMLCMIRNK